MNVFKKKKKKKIKKITLSNPLKNHIEKKASLKSKINDFDKRNEKTREKLKAFDRKQYLIHLRISNPKLKNQLNFS